MVAFAQKCEVIDGMNAVIILGEDKVENGCQLTYPVSWCRNSSSAALSKLFENEFAMEQDRVSQLT